MSTLDDRDAPLMIVNRGGLDAPLTDPYPKVNHGISAGARARLAPQADRGHRRARTGPRRGVGGGTRPAWARGAGGRCPAPDVALALFPGLASPSGAGRGR